MAKTLEEEICELKEKNNLLVQTVQQWKMIAAQREEEKIELMKELNQMRMYMSHYRNSSSTLDSVLESAVQEFGENTLTKLVEVSNSITGTVEVMKSYIRKKQEIERASPSKSTSLLESPKERSSSKVLRVVPMIRGRSIGKPIILLRPIDAAAYGIQQDDSNEANTQEDEVRTPPRHLLQEVYIPLHRIDAESINVNSRTRRTLNLDRDEDIADTSIENTEPRLEEEALRSADDNEMNERQGEGDETQNNDEHNNRRSMETVMEETEDENWSPQVLLCRQLPKSEGMPNKSRSIHDNPLEGPSWLLDRLYTNTGSPVLSREAINRINRNNKASSSEPDSTTDNSQAGSNPTPVATSSPTVSSQPLNAESPASVAYTPTVRVRRRHSHSRVSLALIDEMWSQADPPSDSERESVRHDKDPTKALVMVAKMRIDELSGGTSADGTPRRKAKQPLEAPSPNGSTQDAGPIVMDSSNTLEANVIKPVVESFEKLQLKNTKRPSQSKRQICQKRCSSREKSTERSRKNSSDGSSTNDGNSGATDQIKPDNKGIKKSRKTSNNRGMSIEGRATQERSTQGRSSEELTGVEDRERSSDSESDTANSGTRPKRPRRAPPNYREKPLNRKLRRQD